MDQPDDLEANIYADRFGGLRPPGKRLARAVARRAWINAGGIAEDAIIDFHQDFRIKSLDPALIALLIQLAIKLFEYWLKNRIEEPSVVASADEPISYEDDDAD